jgi:membrane-associated phospholipid phosphatase
MFSAAAATILGHILPSRAGAYMSMAQEAANSRIYAGIHYSVDCTAGFTVGQNVGNYAVQRALKDGAE